MYEFSFASLFVFIFSAVIACLLLVITIYDFRHKIIPDKIVYPFIILCLVSIIWKVTAVAGFAFLPAIVAGPLLAAPFFFLYFFSKGKAMGFGDVKLALGIGWLVGIVGAISVFLLSFWIGAIVGVVLMAFSKRHGIKSEIPFAPFMIVATAIVSILGVGIQTFFPIWF
jgi:leader peptidase (prepilin peptidase)/N-methyltransferase